MQCLSIIILIIGLFAICDGQFDGRYRVQTTPRYTTFRPFTTTARPAGRYTSAGRYSGDNSGRRRDNSDGRYVPNPNDGKYIHKVEPYKHIDVGGGKYGGHTGRYIPDPNAGKYIHKDDPYKHLDVAGGRYSGSSDRGTGGGYYKGDKDKQYPYQDKQYGDGGSGGSGQNQGSGSRQGSASGSVSQDGRLNSGSDGSNSGAGGSNSGAGGSNSGAGGSNSGARRPYRGGNDSNKGKGDYGRFDKKYDIIHLARKGYRDGYFYTYETENGILAEETSQDQAVNKDGATSSNKAGWYEYTGPDGKLYHVDYTAGEEGFVPQADFIPTIPPLIQKALEWLKTHEDKSQQQVSRQ